MTDREKPSKGKKSSVEVLVAKYGFAGTIVAALLGATALIIAAYIGYLAALQPCDCPPLPTPTPAPQARISEPTDGQRVPSNAKVVVEFKNIPPDRYLWVAVRIPKVQPTWWIYPQLHDRQVPPHWVGTGMLTTVAAFGGGSEDSGAPFNLTILLVDEKAHRSFTAYADNCGRVATSCIGIAPPDAEMQILDFSTVIRE